jgi:FG-GAP-like repeat
VYFQQKDGQLAAPKTFPTLTGVSDVAVGDWDSDGRPEIFLLSADERQVGVTRLDEKGGIPFPDLLPLDGRPLALAAGKIHDTQRVSLAVLVDQDGARSLRIRTADGQTMAQSLNANFKSNPSTFAIHDADQDGRPDLVVLIPYEKIKLLRQNQDQAFDEIDLAPPGGSIEQPWLSVADVDGDAKTELLLAQKNFLRAVVLKAGSRTDTAGAGRPGWSFSVKEQINGAASNSRIVAAAPLSNSGSPMPSLFLLDAEKRSLTLCERDKAGVWQVIRNIELPTSEFNALEAVGLGSSQPNAVAFMGLQAVAWMPFAGDTWAFAELDSYETPIKDGFLMDVVAGDLNQDKRKDLVFLETAKSYIDIVTFEPPHQLIPTDRWQVFEERTFRNRRSEAPEPREAVVADLTGDGKNDLAVVVHDRVLVYPQE